MKWIILLALLFVLCAANVEGTPTPCVYGADDEMTLGNLLARTISLDIVCALAYFGISLAGGCVLYIIFSMPSFVISATIASLICDIIARRWQTWRYFGPGDTYGDISGNEFVFITHATRCAFHKLCQLVATFVFARYAFLVEDNRVPRWFTGVRCALGVLVALGMSCVTGYYAFTMGVPSFYRGEDSINPMSCSGPAAWSQLEGYVRFTIIVPFLTPVMYSIPYLSVPFSIAAITTSSITIGRAWNDYHRVGAIANLFTYVPALLGAIFVPKRKIPYISNSSNNDADAM